MTGVPVRNIVSMRATRQCVLTQSPYLGRVSEGCLNFDGLSRHSLSRSTRRRISFDSVNRKRFGKRVTGWVHIQLYTKKSSDRRCTWSHSCSQASAVSDCRQLESTPADTRKAHPPCRMCHFKEETRWRHQPHVNERPPHSMATCYRDFRKGSTRAGDLNADFRTVWTFFAVTWRSSSFVATGSMR